MVIWIIIIKKIVVVYNRGVKTNEIYYICITFYVFMFEYQWKNYVHHVKYDLFIIFKREER